VYTLRHLTPGRVPDLVVFPECHAHVEAIVAAAAKHNVVVIPFGGGTTVTGAVQCPPSEKRMIVSLDTSKVHVCVCMCACVRAFVRSYVPVCVSVAGMFDR
jgi:alkyldihydroxyacetonephosphate synthase